MIENEQQVRPGSEVHLDEWVTPEIADENGYIRAGKILEWMDVVGVLAATRHCRRPVVTASVDGMELQKPIRVGERIAMTGSVAFTSARSIGVSVATGHNDTTRIRNGASSTARVLPSVITAALEAL